MDEGERARLTQAYVDSRPDIYGGVVIATVQAREEDRKEEEEEEDEYVAEEEEEDDEEEERGIIAPFIKPPSRYSNAAILRAIREIVTEMEDLDTDDIKNESFLVHQLQTCLSAFYLNVANKSMPIQSVAAFFNTWHSTVASASEAAHARMSWVSNTKSAAKAGMP